MLTSSTSELIATCERFFVRGGVFRPLVHVPASTSPKTERDIGSNVDLFIREGDTVVFISSRVDCGEKDDRGDYVVLEFLSAARCCRVYVTYRGFPKLSKLFEELSPRGGGLAARSDPR